ncbi:MAG: hypothetical protein E6K72_11675 [Candidatus Eisenbacteria bacterium]|uniref:Uncharacterized protein n=1 Tax=Eiseniibacteriota bacterium TaxID=2212470 RepID=A0A538SFN3_UNCEI|nr:MAG: hypothetical protein E6K72_11675 [Candidatus Eisenbacteria bacterium]
MAGITTAHSAPRVLATKAAAPSSPSSNLTPRLPRGAPRYTTRQPPPGSAANSNLSAAATVPPSPPARVVSGPREEARGGRSTTVRVVARPAASRATILSGRGASPGRTTMVPAS